VIRGALRACRRILGIGTSAIQRVIAANSCRRLGILQQLHHRVARARSRWCRDRELEPRPKYTFRPFLEFPRPTARKTIARRSAVSSRQTKFLSENLMADVYLGIAIAGVNTLIVMGAAFAFVVI
jgi:hypothetical protein